MKSLIQNLGAVALLCLLPISSPAFGQHQHDEEAAGHAHDRSQAHGGSSTMTKEFHFETVFHEDAVSIYLYDGSQAPLDAQGVMGTVDIQFRDRNRQALHAELEYVSAESEEFGYLRGALDLSEIADGEAKATVELHGLSGRAEEDVSFRETFRLAEESGHDSHGDDHDEGHGDDHGDGHGDEHGDDHGDEHGDDHGDHHG